MGIQPVKSFILNPPFQPGAAALPHGGAHFLIREHAIPFGPKSHRERDKTIQVGSLSKLLMQAPIHQNELAEAFQIQGSDSQGSTAFWIGCAPGMREASEMRGVSTDTADSRKRIRLGFAEMNVKKTGHLRFSLFLWGHA
jgi:hypothetical protein